MRVYKRLETIRCLYCTRSFYDPEIGYDCCYDTSANYCDKFECDETNFNKLMEDMRRKVFEWSVTNNDLS